MYETEKETRIKTYITNYLNELKRHFDISDKKMHSILFEVYKEACPISKLKTFIKKCMSMVKSFYKRKIKKDL